MVFRFQISGVRRLLLFKSFQNYSTTAAPAQPPQNYFLVDYLINSLGLSKDEALSATKKVMLYKSYKNHPDLVVSFFKELGLDRSQIRSIASAHPRLLTCNVEKTLRPKVLALQELGMSGCDLIRVMMSYKLILAKGLIRQPIEYLRNILGSDENVVKVIKRSGSVLDTSVTRVIESNVQLLQKHGFSKEYATRFLLQNPRCLTQKTERLKEVLHMVENELEIPRHSKMFYYGVLVVSCVSKTTFLMKLRVWRSFGLSDLTIYSMIKQHPSIIGTSENKIGKIWNFFTHEIGYPPDFLPSHPNIFNLSLEKRVMPRYEVLKVLNEKNLNKTKAGLYRILCISEAAFVDGFLLPYKDEIPDVVDSYFKIVGKKKTRKL